MCKNRIISIIAVFLVSVLVLAFIAAADWAGVIARAQYKRDYTELSTEELDDLSYRTSVSDELPQMTVFVHGLGGKASHWASNDQYVFDYEASSMPETLRNYVNILNGENSAEIIAVKPSYELNNSKGASKSKAEAQSKVLEQTTDAGKGNGAVELRGMYEKYKPDSSNQSSNEDEAETETNDWGIEIYDCNINDYPIIKEKGGDSPDRNSLIESDVTKHIIVIFEQWQGEVREGNDFVYSQFEYCMDALSYQYAQLTGELPTVNLIAHSRGGITAMQYALAHPYNVASIYTMGAPFNGSDFGSVEINGEHPLLSLATYKPDYQYKDGQDYAPGVLDILNSDLSESYKKFWNNHYEEYYSHIQFKPIGSYVNIDFILKVVLEWLQTLDPEKRDKIESIVTAVGLYLSYDYIISPVLFTIKATVVTKYLINLLNNEPEFYHIIEILANIKPIKSSYGHIGKYFAGSIVLEDDLFIDLGSQVAEGYKGAKRKVKLFKSGDFDAKESINNINVAHNLETHNQDIIDYIVHDLNFGASEGIFSARYSTDGCYITNLNNSLAQGELVIPETYNGFTVIGIDGLTRDLDTSENQTYHTGITSVKIPSSVKKIGDYAFYGMSNLQSITFNGGNNVEEIGYFAFANCTSLTSFEIGKNVQFIGEAAFGGCDALASFSLQSGNQSYNCSDGVIYSKDGTALNFFPAGRGGTFTVPETVSSIGAGAFYGNDKLTGIDLNQVRILHDYAFADCTALGNVSANKLDSVDIGAFENTPWLDNADEEYVSLGTVLLRYQGDDEELEISEYSSISPFCFSNCTSLKKIYFEGGNLNTIGAMNFIGCANLQEITIRNPYRKVSAGETLFDSESSCKVYVSSKFIDDYKTDVMWGVYQDRINDIYISIHFVDGETVEPFTKQVKWGEALSGMPILEKEGYEFVGWYKNPNAEGQRYSDGILNMDLNDFTLYANWRLKPYSILYDLNGGQNHPENPTEYDIEHSVTIKDPTRTGYTFVGWECDGSMLENNQISGRTGDICLKAVWEANTISVGFDPRGSNDYPATPIGRDSVLFDSDAFKFEVPERPGFKFLGWCYNNIRYTDAEGNAIRVWDMPVSTILYAEWEAESFKIRYDAETGSIYFSGSAWTDEEVEVTVGMQLSNENIIEETFQQYYKIQDKIIRYFYYLKPNGDRVAFRLSSTSMPFLESMNGTVEFFAEFRQEVHTIFFATDVQGQNFSSLKADSASNIFGELNSRIPTRKGYTFGGWKITAAPDNVALEGTILGDTMPDCSSEQLDSSCLVHAIWNPILVLIELDSSGGSSVSSQQVLYGSEFSLPIPVKEGFAFDGWYDAEGVRFTSASGESLDVLKETELVLIAHWNVISYSITYELNGGQNSVENISAYNINTIFKLQAPTRTNYRFDGWYTDPQYLNVITEIRQKTGNLILYAKWIELYKIEIVDDSVIADTLTGIYGELITLPTYIRAGFDGSIRDEKENKIYTFGSVYEIRGNKILNVYWQSNDILGTYLIREEEVKINDSGRFKNHYDVLDLTKLTGGRNIQELKDKGYKTLRLTISLDIKEIDDGLQYVFIYYSEGSDAQEIDRFEISHGGAGKNTSYGNYVHTFLLKLSDIPSDKIYIRYGASGKWDDDWKNKNINASGVFFQIE